MAQYEEYEEDGDGKLPRVDHGPLNKWAVGKNKLYNNGLLK